MRTLPHPLAQGDIVSAHASGRPRRCPPSGGCRAARQVFDSPLAAHLGLAPSIEHPAVGASRVVSSPLHLFEMPVALRYPPPLLGEHTAAVLRELGYEEGDIEEMRTEGAL